MGQNLGNDYGASNVVYFRWDCGLCLFWGVFVCVFLLVFLFFSSHQPLVNALSNRNLSQFCLSISPYQHTRVYILYLLPSEGLFGAAVFGAIFPCWGLMLAKTQAMFYYTDPNTIRDNANTLACYYILLGVLAIFSATLQFWGTAQVAEHIIQTHAHTYTCTYTYTCSPTHMHIHIRPHDLSPIKLLTLILTLTLSHTHLFLSIANMTVTMTTIRLASEFL